MSEEQSKLLGQAPCLAEAVPVICSRSENRPTLSLWNVAKAHPSSPLPLQSVSLLSCTEAVTAHMPAHMRLVLICADRHMTVHDVACNPQRGTFHTCKVEC